MRHDFDKAKRRLHRIGIRHIAIALVKLAMKGRFISILLTRDGAQSRSTRRDGG
jgi:hypothetical protein